jgi:hypothetical protein
VAPPAPVVSVVHARPLVHHHRVVHRRHRAVHRVHKPAPKTTAADPVPTEVAPAHVAALRTAAITPIKVVRGDSNSGKLLLMAAFALLLVAVASASLLRVLVELNKPRRGW